MATRSNRLSFSGVCLCLRSLRGANQDNFFVYIKFLRTPAVRLQIIAGMENTKLRIKIRQVAVLIFTGPTMYHISSFELVNQIERQSIVTYNLYISCYPRHYCFLHAEK